MTWTLLVLGFLALLALSLLLAWLLTRGQENGPVSATAWNRYLDTLQRKLLRANLYIRAEELILICLIVAFIFFLTALLLGLGFFLALLSAVAGYAIPGYILERRRKINLRKLETQLPAVLSIIANAVRSGYSFAQALEVVYQDTMPPLSEECGRVLRDNRLGRPMGEALRRMASRVGSEDLDIVVNTLEIQRQLGGNMAVLLNKLEQTLRERAELEAEIKALTAQQRFSAVLIFLLPIILAVFLLLTNPDYLKPLVEEQLGRYLLGAAVIAQLLGLLVMRRMMKVKY
jgi:tight adherence protein B